MPSFNGSTEQIVAAPGEALIFLLVCSMAKQSLSPARARLSEMSVEEQTVNGGLLF